MFRSNSNKNLDLPMREGEIKVLNKELEDLLKSLNEGDKKFLNPNSNSDNSNPNVNPNSNLNSITNQTNEERELNKYTISQIANQLEKDMNDFNLFFKSKYSGKS